MQEKWSHTKELNHLGEQLEREPVPTPSVSLDNNAAITSGAEQTGTMFSDPKGPLPVERFDKDIAIPYVLR
ncbi:MAG TPA: hypothetical protein GX717_08270, partial [Clostridiaceae bacterium]|nr:hypothetical protein [Clostridiaceae bacterium]